MSDDVQIPQLTLETDFDDLIVNEDGNTDGEKPKLTEIIILEKKDPVLPVEELQKLTDEEMKMVEEFSKQIDLTDNKQVLLYGAAAQKHIADFSDSALQSVRTKDTGEVGTMLTSLVVQLKNFNSDTAEEKKGGIRGLFSKGRQSLDKIKSSYSSVEKNVDSIGKELKTHQGKLLKDVAMLDKMYEMNKGYFKELTLYIAAGDKKLAQTRETVLQELRAKAKESGEALDAQAVHDMENLCDRFEKKLFDLKLTRQVSLQMAPQIRMIQNNDTMLVEKIQSSLVNTIPLWKSQIVMALGLSNSQNAMKAQREVTDLTNQMLKRNAEMLKTGTVEIAKESERGIIDIDTLKYTNQTLISTFDEVLRIQEDGRSKRVQAEGELRQIEGELKNKLLNLRG
ncbi:MAG: toxic anion resistance protein [Oscillospiraceae bacterium]|nr:toxic anion resistance protein [Oscillospiraceae bacterium]